MAYIECLESGHSPRIGTEQLDPQTARCEQIWLRLRTCQGVALTAAEHHVLLQSDQLQALLDADLLTLNGSQLALTPQGFPLADRIGIELTTAFESATPALPTTLTAEAQPVSSS